MNSAIVVVERVKKGEDRSEPLILRRASACLVSVL